MTKVKRRTPRDEVVKEEVDRDSLGLDTDDDVTFNSVTATTSVTAADATINDQLRLTETTGVDLSSTGHAAQIGADAAQNTAWDPGEVQSRSNGSAAAYEVNRNGGILKVNSATEGGLELGPNGGTVKQIYTGSTTWDPPNHGVTIQQTTTVTATGAAVGDIAIAGYPADWSGFTGNLDFQWQAYVSSANTVTISFFYVGNPSEQTVNVIVFHL